jgi:hypothetical protein
VGRLLSVLTLATGVTLIADALPGNDDGANRELTRMLAVTGLLLAVLFWVIPWQRLPRSASRLALPIGFTLIAFGGVIDPNPYTYGLPFLTMYLYPRTLDEHLVAVVVVLRGCWRRWIA